MAATFKRQVYIKGNGCVRDATLLLTSLHALIGPNDSGKSSILRALSTVFPFVDEHNRATDAWMANRPESAEARRARMLRIPRNEGSGRRSILRLDPDVLREPVGLLPTVQQELWFTNDRGHGLAGLYDALLGRDRAAFALLEDQFKVLFPTVAALRLDNTTDARKMLGLTLREGTVVSASQMSEGMLYWLAFAIIEHLSPAEMILIEEPENGLHPSRIREVMRIFRRISEHTQIVVATHSPLVINELEPDEVTIVTRTKERGTICTPMRQTKNFQERAEVYALGELWLSYADGDLEKELVGNGDDRAGASKAE